MKYILAFLLLFSQVAFGTDFYVTNAGAGAKNGTNEANACQTFADADCATLSAGDTLVIVGTVVDDLTVGQDGTSAAHITINCESGSSAGVIDATGNTNGLVLSSRDYIDIVGCEIKNATSHGVYTLGPATNITFTRTVSHDNGGRGFFWTSTNPGADATARVVDRITTTDIQAYNNGGAGIHEEYACQNFKHIRPISYNNGTVSDEHGISVVPNRSSWSSHTSVSGDVYSVTYGFGLQGFAPSKVYNTTDGTILTYTNTSGVYGDLAANQWDYALNDKIYYNIGGSPTGKTLEAMANNSSGLIVSPTVYNTQLISGEGTGIQFDDGTQNWSIYGGRVYDNEGPGFQCNRCSNVTLSGVMIYGHDSSTPSSRGQRGLFINGPAENVTLRNLTLDDNGYGLIIASGNVANLKFGNSIISNSGTRGFEDPSNFIQSYVADGANHYYNNVSNSSGTAATTDYNARSLTGNPDPVYVSATDLRLQSSSPDISIGKDLYPCYDMNGAKCLGLKEMGAYQNQFVPYGYTLKPKERRN